MGQSVEAKPSRYAGKGRVLAFLRFGVNHKELLKAVCAGVDVLTLTATPIPRTLQLARLGIRDLSPLLTPPPGRRRVETRVGPEDPEVLREALARELARGGQMYCVTPQVADLPRVVAAVRAAAPGVRVLVAHGGLADVEDRLLSFSRGEARVLVSTAIVESGLDIPTANTMVIFNAQRFGLATLHQLRGRVGRASTAALALLQYPPDATLTPEARQRLDALQEFSALGSGPSLARRDLEIRGAGSLVGADQSGFGGAGPSHKLYAQMLEEELLKASQVVTGGVDSSGTAAQDDQQLI